MIDRIDNRAHLGGLAQYQQRVRERGTRSAESVDGAWASDGHAFCPPDNWEHVQVLGFRNVRVRPKLADGSGPSAREYRV